ncbi:putative ATP-dependent permease [Mycena venus]|uniref:Putative ATP-dependent permease n=1 Tax=Mycena venus TaxID=2733690 RepID=A0A8H6Y5P6_9AGAR|nr:putative ATP-dependent permease [Mycena venus]
MSRLAAVLLLLGLVSAQSCSNYGLQNGSACLCPTGFGGSDCASPGCGGDIFQGSHRALAPGTLPNANASDASCSCEAGWGGTGCNVCQTSSACQTAFSTSGNAPSSSQSISGAQSGQNSTLTCNSAARVYAASQMSCQVLNPTLQALYPLAANLNIIRTLQPGFSPLPNTTSFGSAGTVFAQLFYAGVEQFYCLADTCKQDLATAGQTNWNCQNLKCTCIPKTQFCGAGVSDLTGTINSLTGTLAIECDNATTCAFKQDTLDQLFGSGGISLSGCMFGECVAQSVIDTASDTTTGSGGTTGAQLSGGVIGGLAVVGGLVLIALAFLVFGLIRQRSARRTKTDVADGSRLAVEWSRVSYVVSAPSRSWFGGRAREDDKVVLDAVSGRVAPGQMMAVLGPSGAGKTTLVEILAGKAKSGTTSGRVAFPSANNSTTAPRIGFVPQQDVLPPMLTVYEALLFGARLRLPESVSDAEKRERVEGIMQTLGIAPLRNVRIGWGGDVGGGKARGISGGPDVLILDEPTSGLDSVSASRVAKVLHAIAHDPENPIPIIASIHQPSSQLYQIFDSILVMSHGRALYSGPGGFAPAEYFAREASGVAPPYQQGYNVADYLLEVASEPPVALFQLHSEKTAVHGQEEGDGSEQDTASAEKRGSPASQTTLAKAAPAPGRSKYAATFLTQLEYLCGREWKILRRDKSLFFTHIAVSSVLGVFCGGLYFQTGITIAGFQSRVGCLFFLGALIAFSSLSALYNVVEIRPAILARASNGMATLSAAVRCRALTNHSNNNCFDYVSLQFLFYLNRRRAHRPGSTYWMAGLAHDPAHYFKFLFILVLYTLAMTLFNFLLGTFFHNGGIAILLSALSALYQMTFAGFFVHLNSIPPVLRWLQWLCPLKYCLEALAVNEVGSGLMIEDTLSGVPVDVSASLIMNLLFGFGSNNYYRDVLVLFAFIAGFGLGVIGIVWLRVRERR